MKYQFTLPTKPHKQAEVEISLFTGRHRLWIDGEEMSHEGKNKKIFNIQQGKKNAKTLRLQPNVFNLGLIAIYGGKRINVSSKLAIIDYIIGYMPFLLGLVAASYFDAEGIDGILIGVTSVFLSLFNIYLIRQAEGNKMMATLYNAGVIAGSWGLYYLICRFI